MDFKDIDLNTTEISFDFELSKGYVPYIKIKDEYVKIKNFPKSILKAVHNLS